LEWESGRGMAHRYARTATTDIIRMRAHLTGTTVLAGSTAACLSEQVRGSAAGLDSGRDSDLGDLDLDGPDSVDDLDSAGVPDSADGLDLVAGRESEYVDRLVRDSTAECHTVVAFIPAAASMAAVRMAEVHRTAEAVRMVAATAAGTGKI
jgi:hypothetical protein